VGGQPLLWGAACCPDERASYRTTSNEIAGQTAYPQVPLLPS
jgi:hypothetical protein